MGQHKETDDGRNCWRTARERDRLRARFLIRERVAASSDDTPLDAVTTSPATIEWSPLDIHKLQQNLRYIHSGDRSKFSLTFMLDQHQLLSSPISTEYLQESLPQTLQLCTAWFGIEYATFLDHYISSLETFTVLEYAVWMGKYSILGALLVGGVSPCVKSASRSAKEQHNNTEWNERLQKLGTTRVLNRFFDAFPLPLSTYIVKRVVDLRMDAYRNRGDQTNSDHHHHVACTKCQQQTPPSFQLWVSPCGHAVCEPCLWKDMMDHIDERGNLDDVVLCPNCGVSGTESSTTCQETRLSSSQEAMTPSRKCQESLIKYEQLPSNRQALKARREKRKKLSEKEYLASSWFAAVAPSLGLSQDVRRDKFFASIERNAIHYARGCLVAGADVHWTNEYGQTALYMCAWRGNAEMVQLFLDYGANPSVCVNGGSTVSSVCKTNGHEDVLRVLHEHDQWEEDDPVQREHPLSTVSIRQDTIPLHAEILIEEDLDHPGAGSYVIDEVLSSDIVDRFLELWRSLPTDTSHQKKKGVPCSERSYYCDAEGYVRELLTNMIERTHLASPMQSVTVFPHMRFLNYAEAGTVLAPHVDLCRVDPDTGNRSTHSFLLYVTDCEKGGETSLLGGISGDDRNHVLARICPKRGRLLLFPHACPHEGNGVYDIPKILLRGEIMLSSTRVQEQS